MIEFRQVDKGFAATPVLHGLSFRVEPGEVYGLLGPNGCGKSTAINLLCGLLDPDSGEVLLSGRPADAAARRNIGAAPQEIALYRDLTCAENLRFFGEIYGVSRDRLAARVTELLRRVPAAQVALVEAPLETGAEARVEARAAELGWGVRRYAGRLALLQSEALSLRQTVELLDGLGLASLALQPVRLEHAYLEILAAA